MKQNSELEDRVAVLERQLSSVYDVLQRADHNTRALEVMLCTLIDHSIPDEPKEGIAWLDAMEKTALHNMESLTELASDQMIREGASREMVAAYERQQGAVSFVMSNLYAALRKPRELGSES